MRALVNWWTGLSVAWQVTLGPLIVSLVAAVLVVGLVRPAKARNAAERAADAEYERRRTHGDGDS